MALFYITEHDVYSSCKYQNANNCWHFNKISKINTSECFRARKIIILQYFIVFIGATHMLYSVELIMIKVIFYGFVSWMPNDTMELVGCKFEYS